MRSNPFDTRHCSEKRSLVLVELFATALVLFFGWTLSPLQAQPQPAIPFSEGEYRERDLEIKRQDLDLRRKAMHLERQKAWLSALATIVPIIAGAVAVWGVIVSANRSANAALTASTRTTEATLITKLTELSLQGEGPLEVINRAKLLVGMYANRLPGDFVENVKKIKADEIGRIATEAPWPTEFSKNLVEMLAKYPSQRQQILLDYKAILPYEFIDVLTETPVVAQPAEQPPYSGST
jgi:hypothetical protein